ncbi:MAG: hypothetical protein DME24_13585 [Verrucomicrobia bacterium]|nr:MAG: hypothetical protein DME24_13585 [Verrucomicrobiota bacterium]
MPTPHYAVSLEEQIDQWRSYLRRRQAIHSVDIAELEDHLRGQVAGLVDAGLATDEAFLVAVKRMGNLDALSREFAREHSDRLWKQLVVSPSDPGAPQVVARTDAIVAFCLAVVAAVFVKVPALFGIPMNDPHAGFYVRNASYFVLPLLTGYFAWKRQLDAGTLRWLAAAFVAGGIFANVYPFAKDSHVEFGSTEALSALHLPMALWFAVGIAYAGARWRQVAGRMDFIRFSGELFIYYVLIGFDLLLALILGLLLYSISARDPRQPPGTFDVVQVVLVISALLADAVALWAIAARISEFGFTPNRVAALGENVILLVNLVWSAVLYIRFLCGRGSFSNLERWQTDYLSVYVAWAAIVVILFPPLFRYL